MHFNFFEIYIPDTIVIERKEAKQFIYEGGWNETCKSVPQTARRLQVNIDVPLPLTFPGVWGDPGSFYEKCLSRMFLA